MRSAASSVLPPDVLEREFRSELIAIADWWATHTVDRQQGGFYGEVRGDNRPVVGASKGIILNARILWFFSETARQVDAPAYRDCATRAYRYLVDHFLDTTHGGFYWELDAAGRPISTKKQVYAQAFTLYALCAYYQLTEDEQALAYALECFRLIERHAVDHQHQGYLEAFTCEWGTVDDLRLSEKDLNYPKSQNTHLHILEAYTRLHLVHPSPEVKAALRYTIEMFDKYIINKENYHLRMFMDMEWKDHSPGYTYGHDIEAGWLIAQALDSLGDEAYTQTLTPTLVNIIATTLNEGIGEQGQVLDFYDFASGTVNRDAVWWVQAEALVGFLYAYQISGDTRYFAAADAVWKFIKQYQRDLFTGEWLWYSRLPGTTVEATYKVGFWKCPYHNGRAMIEAIRYLHPRA